MAANLPSKSALVVPESLALLQSYGSDEDEDPIENSDALLCEALLCMGRSKEAVVTPQSSELAECDTSSYVVTPQSSEPAACDTSSYFVTEKVFESREELTSWCKVVGRECGVVVIVKQCELPKNGRRGRISYCCERSGKSRTISEKAEKKLGTKKCGCPFLLKGVKLPVGDQWKLQLINGKHNHEVDKDTTFEGHPVISRLSKEEEEIVRNMSICGAKPKEILRVLKEKNPNNASTVSTIYNFKAKHRIYELQERK